MVMRGALLRATLQNSFAFYNHDGQEGKHNLRLADYGHAMDVHESGKWVMLRKVVS